MSSDNTLTRQREPLIVDGDVEAQAKAKEKVSYMSLPNKKQLAILCIARLADPLAASSIQVRFVPPNENNSDLFRLTCFINSDISTPRRQKA